MLVVYCLLLFINTVCGQTVTALAGDTAVIPCRILFFIYPKWNGPPNSAIYTNQNSSQFNPNLANFARLSYNTDQRSINISNTATSDAGMFSCAKTANGVLFTENVTLVVRVSPSAPTFSTNVGQISNNRLIVTEDQVVTLTCTSRGANPVSTVTLYQTSVSGSHVIQTSTGTQEADGTWTVTLNFPFTTVRSLDRLNFFCTSTFPTAPIAQQTAPIKLYFNLKPSTPSIARIGTPVSGQSTQAIARCTTSGFRPATGISMSMTFRGVTRNYTTVVGPSSTDTYSVTGNYSKAVDKTDNGQTLKCSISHSTLQSSLSRTTLISVQFAPRTVSVSGNTNVIVDGINTVSVTCTTGEANPQSDITWRRTNSPITSSSNIVYQDGQYGGKTSTQTLEFIPTRDDTSVTCRASNTYTNSPVSDTIILDTKYPPFITTTPTSSVTKTEGSGNQLLKCAVSSRPLSTIKWYKNGQGIKTGSVNTDNNRLDYTISNIDRDKTGEYKCEANNNIGGTVTKTVQVIVQYAPDVTVTTTNTTESAASVDVVCQPSGVPTTSDITQWTQTWTDGTVIHSNLPLQHTLTLTDLSYQQSGLYTCQASNGIPASNNPNAGVGEAYLLVKSRPIVIEPLLDENKTYKASAQLGVPISIVITYYSNAENDKVDLYEGVGDTNRKLVAASINTTDTTVQLPVFQQTVQTTGRHAFITLTIRQHQDFQNYSIDVNNDIGHSILVWEINPEGPPESPDILTIGDPTETSITVFWIPGFHGGADQTFVIQVSSDEQDWRNVTTVNGFKVVGNAPLNETITGLSTATFYFIRLFSYNRFGHSPGFTKHLSFITKGVSKVIENNTSSLGVIIGATIAGIVVIILVVVAVVVVRKYECNCQKKSAHSKSAEETKNHYENVTESNIDNVQRNNDSEQASYYNIGRESEPVPSTYESLTDREPTPIMYSSLQNIEMAPTKNIASDPAVSEPIQSQYESLTDRVTAPNMYSSLDNIESSPDRQVASNAGHVYANLKI